MAKTSKSYYGFADCTTLHCPRTDDPKLSPTVSKSQLSQDASGHYWCSLCIRRCALMDWAHENQWPSVRVQGSMRYAIDGDAEEWLTSTMAASQDMVDALYETLIEKKRAQIGPQAHSDAVERIEKLLDTVDE